MTNRRILVLFASVAVSAALLLVILHDVPIDAVVASIRAADPGLLLLAFALVAVALLLRGIRWSVLLDRRIPILPATHMVNVMFLGNQLPLRLGEVARSVLATRSQVPLGTSASSIVVERLARYLDRCANDMPPPWAGRPMLASAPRYSVSLR